MENYRFPGIEASGEKIQATVQKNMLLRGGEALELQKIDNRFTVRLVNATADCSQLFQPMHVQACRLLPSLQLTELQVEPEHLEPAMRIARTSQAIAFASHVYQWQNSPGALLYLTDQITIQFAHPSTHPFANRFANTVGPEQIRSIAASAGLQIIKLVPGVAKCFVFRVMPQATANPLKIAQRLITHPAVLLAEPNVAVSIQMSRDLGQPDCPDPDCPDPDCPDPDCPDPAIRQPRHLDTALANLTTDLYRATAAAWETTQGDRSTVVAVMDEPIDCNHPNLTSIGKIVAPWGQNHQTSQQTHGTLYACIAVAEKKGTTPRGIAPGCALMPIAIGNFLDDQSIETLFEWACQQGAAVICCGWTAKPAYYPLSLRQRMAIARAATQGRGGKGCVIVFAAGSNSTVEEAQPEQKAQSESRWLNGFALHPDVITVATTHCLDLKGTSGNREPGDCKSGYWHNVTIASPSSNHPEALARGMSGAEAIVAGVVALVLSVNPNLTATAVKQILQETADKGVEEGVDILASAQPHLCSVPTISAQAIYDAAGHSQRLGYGQVNVLKAVQAAQQTQSRSLVAQWLQFHNREAIAIPDADRQGVISVIVVEDDRQVLEIEITVHFMHPFASDLALYLLAPNGATVLLQSRSLGKIGNTSKTSISKIYTFETTPLLRRLSCQPARGQWELKLIDGAISDIGRLESWMLSLGV
ncbi:MAG: S8 family serine peptidase [Leptolyngbyaceae cyanobacterium CRU_2_3]|nr:S8 family serine peptidase [Leptolyngbyaceae cyanobacterium CRU_2_3]